MSWRTLGISACIVSSLLTLACGDSPLGPSQNSVPQVVNVTDDFEFQAANVTNVTHTYLYTWINTGTVAVVTHSDSISSGTATLILRDASGVVRGDIDLKSGASFTSASGTPGQWQVELRLLGVDGNLNLKVQKG